MKITLIYPTPPPICKLHHDLTQKQRKNQHKTPLTPPIIVKCLKKHTKYLQNIADEKLPKNPPRSPYNCRMCVKMPQKTPLLAPIIVDSREIAAKSSKNIAP